jgi:hypothetical protein
MALDGLGRLVELRGCAEERLDRLAMTMEYGIRYRLPMHAVTCEINLIGLGALCLLLQAGKGS